MKTRCRIAAVGLPLLILTAPIIGPFTYFPAIWPYLSLVLPRPDVVSSGAVASYSWKANGTHWRWQDDLPSGCAFWSGGSTADDYIAVTFATGQKQCNGAADRFGFFQAESPKVSFFRNGESTHYYSPTSARLTLEEREILAQLTSEAMQVAETPGGARVLGYIRDWLDQTGQ